MEAAGAKILYERSVGLLGLRYISFIGDGDSKVYSTLLQAALYVPAVYIQKEECISQVTKRMGTGLRKLLQDCKIKFMANTV